VGWLFRKKLAGTGGSYATLSVYFYAGIAQLVEQLICNQQVVSSNLTAGSLSQRDLRKLAGSMTVFSGVSVPRRYHENFGLFIF
jgi:hypothetical protein